MEKQSTTSGKIQPSTTLEAKKLKKIKKPNKIKNG